MMIKALFVAFLLSLLAAAPAVAEVPSWGLDRIDQETLPLDGSYKASADGSGVSIYVVGSGVAASPEFGDRLQEGYGPAGSCSAEGTAAAAVAAGSTYGVAPGAKIYPVRVDNCTGFSDMRAGLSWIAENKAERSVILILPSVILDIFVNEQAASIARSGTPVLAAAGDDTWDSCSKTPSSAPEVMSVGASGATDQPAAFSNWGACIDIWAPGQNITSLSGSGPGNFSGTAFAAAHVAGVAAMHIEKGRSAVREQIEAAATDSIRSNNTASSKLLYLGDLREGQAARYSPPALLDPPSLATSDSAQWRFSGGQYADGEKSGTWVDNVLWDGEAFRTEMRCILRNKEGQEVRTWSYSEASEPSSCSLSLAGLPDGDYTFAARKDLISETRRIAGYESRAPLEVDLMGPEAVWQDAPEPTRAAFLVYNLTVRDRGTITGISGSDFTSKGTARGCTFFPLPTSLPAGGGNVEVKISCNEDGTVRPELQPVSFASSGRSGPASAVLAGESAFDRTPPTTLVSSSPGDSTSSVAEFIFTASEEASFQCRRNLRDWNACSSPWVLRNLAPGDYSVEIRATDRAGNIEVVPFSHLWEVLPPAASRPTNDMFRAALPLPTSANGSSKGATRENGEPDHGQNSWRSVWYTWTAPDDGDIDISTRGSKIDTMLNLYSGDTLSSLKRVRQSDDWQGWPWSRVTLTVKKDQQFYISLSGTFSSAGAYRIGHRFYPKGKLPPASRIVSFKRYRPKGKIVLRLGVRGEGAPYSFQCRIMPKAWRPCSSPFVRSGLRKGRVYTVEVRTVSAEGLAELRPTRVRFRI